MRHFPRSNSYIQKAFTPYIWDLHYKVKFGHFGHFQGAQMQTVNRAEGINKTSLKKKKLSSNIKKL